MFIEKFHIEITTTYGQACVFFFANGLNLQKDHKMN